MERSPGQSADLDESAAELHESQAGKALRPEEATGTETAAADLSSLLASLLAASTGRGLAADTAAGEPALPDGRVVAARHSASAQQTDNARMAAPVDPGLAPGTLAAESDAGTGGHGTPRGDANEPAPMAASSRADNAMFTLPQLTASAPASPAETAAAPAAPYAAQIGAPVGSPEFAPGLSAQFSVMVRDGLQEARLHLNPAEMGPITVQIKIEGHEAQVTMVAEQASTRQALEQAMPTLASTLRDGGLTLTGGGVFEQAPQNTQQEQQARRDAAPSRRGSGQPGGAEDPFAAPALPTAPVGSHRGILDLYA